MDFEDLLNMLNSGEGPDYMRPLWKKIIDGVPVEKAKRVTSAFFETAKDEGLSGEEIMYLLQLSQDVLISDSPPEMLIELQAARFEFLGRNYRHLIQEAYRDYEKGKEGKIEDFSTFVYDHTKMNLIYDWAQDFRTGTKDLLMEKWKENPELSESELIKMFVLAQQIALIEGMLGGMRTSIREKAHTATVGLTMTFITFCSVILNRIVPFNNPPSKN